MVFAEFRRYDFLCIYFNMINIVFDEIDFYFAWQIWYIWYYGTGLALVGRLVPEKVWEALVQS